MATRVLVTGMGGELGTRVANVLEADRRIEAVVGIDSDPPRRRIHRAEFHRVDPRDRRRVVDVIRSFEPTVVVHLGVYEPNARTGPTSAVARTEAGALAVLGAASECASLDRIVVRSGIEVYGRRRGVPTRPDEAFAPEPTSPFGHSLFHTERVAAWAGAAADVPATLLRFAPVVGSHLASPLGRYLRLPAVPVSALADLPFSVLHLDDAADAIVRAVECGFDGPVNVVAPGAVTPVQAARMGGRVPVPVAGPGWVAVRVAAELLGAPLPEHVAELLRRGRVADGTLAASALGFAPARATPDVVKELYEWAPVARLPTAHAGRRMTSGPGLATFVRHRIDGTYVVDEWGLDRELVEACSPVVGWRWAIDVDGDAHVPLAGPAVLVHNTRFGLSERFVVARGVRDASARWVRPLGAPDVAVVGPALRRFGAVLDHPDELAGILRAGHVAALSLAREPRRRHRAGALDPEALAPALARGVPVLPVAVVGRELGRRWRVRIGPVLAAPASRGPLAAADLAERARAAVQSLLDDAFPPRWPFG